MILVTGSAGFIGFHLVKRLLAEGHIVQGIDNINAYYEPSLKEARLAQLLDNPHFKFHRFDITDYASVSAIFLENAPEYVVHLAAQAGVRHSLANPRTYVESNITGFLHILEGCRHAAVKHLIYASSSSVYGLNNKIPFSVHDSSDHPISLYGATKKANEVMAHSYSHLYMLPTTGLRFFSVYGPWGRPDMAYFAFTKAIIDGKPIDIFDKGRMLRDFTYIDDIVESVARIIDRPATPNPNWLVSEPDSASSTAPFRLYNIGNHTPISVDRFIEIIEEGLGKTAIRRQLPAQPGDVLATAADVFELKRDFGFEPKTPVAVGMRNFINWYRDYYRV